MRKSYFLEYVNPLKPMKHLEQVSENFQFSET
jgi:hypothetical protein